MKHVGENPYLQYFIGMKEYGSCPFGASTLVAFRKRFSEQDLAAILEASVPRVETEKRDDSDDENDPPNSGTLVLDATCCPADIACPQGIDLLDQAREKAEKTVDELCQTIAGNVDFAVDYIAAHFPGVAVTRPEGTYMLFLDCSGWCGARKTTIDRVLQAGWDVGVAWQDGRPFHGPCHIRMNLALPLSRVQEAFDRLSKYVFTP